MHSTAQSTAVSSYDQPIMPPRSLEPYWLIAPNGSYYENEKHPMVAKKRELEQQLLQAATQAAERELAIRYEQIHDELEASRAQEEIFAKANPLSQSGPVRRLRAGRYRPRLLAWRRRAMFPSASIRLENL